MDKEQFSKLLLEQKEKGRSLITLISTMHESQNDFGDGMAMFGGEDLYYVPDNELNNFLNKFSEWKSYVSELLKFQFGVDDQFVYEWDSNVGTYISKSEQILPQLKKKVDKGISLLDSFMQRLAFHFHDGHIEKELNQNNIMKPPMVFISHAESDKMFANEIVTLFEFIGVKGKKNLLCTSVDGYRIPLGCDIIEYLRETFNKKNLFVIILHTHDYYTRPVCMNEMGAAWALKTKYFSVLAPDFGFGDMTGVVNSKDVAIKIGAGDCEARINQLKNELVEFFGLPQPDEDRWPHYRDTFIKNCLKYKCTKSEIKAEKNKNEVVTHQAIIALSHPFRLFYKGDGCYPCQIDVKFAAQSKDIYFKAITLSNKNRYVELVGFNVKNDIIKLISFLKPHTLSITKDANYTNRIDECYGSKAIYVEDHKLPSNALETMSFHGVISLKRQMDGYDDFESEGWELHVTYNVCGELTIPLKAIFI